MADSSRSTTAVGDTGICHPYNPYSSRGPYIVNHYLANSGSLLIISWPVTYSRPRACQVSDESRVCRANEGTQNEAQTFQGCGECLGRKRGIVNQIGLDRFGLQQ